MTTNDTAMKTEQELFEEEYKSEYIEFVRRGKVPLWVKGFNRGFEAAWTIARAPLLSKIAELEAKLGEVRIANAELAKAMSENIRCFRNKTTGDFLYVLLSDCHDDLDDWEEVIILPNISNAAIDAAMGDE